MDPIIQAVKKPLSFEENRWLVPVPDAMRGRFYPAIPMKGFDTVSAEARARREREQRLPVSSVTRVRDGKEHANIGYHPLPLEFEYELDPFWAPELHPLNREHGVCPEFLDLRICTIITPKVLVEEYQKSVHAPEGVAPWLTDERLLQTPSADVLENYPHLVRYIVPDLPIEDVLTIMQPPFLADPGLDMLSKTVAELWDGVDAFDDIEKLQPGLYDALMDAREDGLKLMRLRHAIYRDNPILYALAWWYGLDALELLDVYSRKPKWGHQRPRGQGRPSRRCCGAAPCRCSPPYGQPPQPGPTCRFSARCQSATATPSRRCGLARSLALDTSPKKPHKPPIGRLKAPEIDSRSAFGC